jgi:hypothetical protein
MARAQELYSDEQGRLHAAVAAFQVGEGQAGRIKAASAGVEAVR